MTYLTHITCLAPKGLRLKAQGCRFGYPGNWGKKSFSTATRLRQCGETSIRSQPRCGCKGSDCYLSQGSRSGKPWALSRSPFGAKAQNTSCELSCVSQVYQCRSKGCRGGTRWPPSLHSRTFIGLGSATRGGLQCPSLKTSRSNLSR